MISFIFLLLIFNFPLFRINHFSPSIFPLIFPFSSCCHSNWNFLECVLYLKSFGYRWSIWGPAVVHKPTAPYRVPQALGLVSLLSPPFTKVNFLKGSQTSFFPSSNFSSLFLNFSIFICLSFPFNHYQSVQSLSHLWLFETPWTAACQASLSITNSQSLLKLMSIESVKPSHHLILCWPLLPLPSVLPSFRVFSSKSVLCIRWLKYWSFSFSISPSNEYSGLISFRVNWFDILAVQGTLKSLLQKHSSKASVLRCSAFFIVQLSHPYRTTRKTMALTT